MAVIEALAFNGNGYGDFLYNEGVYNDVFRSLAPRSGTELDRPLVTVQIEATRVSVSEGSTPGTVLVHDAGGETEVLSELPGVDVAFVANVSGNLSATTAMFGGGTLRAVEAVAFISDAGYNDLEYNVGNYNEADYGEPVRSQTEFLGIVRARKAQGFVEAEGGALTETGVIRVRLSDIEGAAALAGTESSGVRVVEGEGDAEALSGTEGAAWVVLDATGRVRVFAETEAAALRIRGIPETPVKVTGRVKAFWVKNPAGGSPWQRINDA